MLNAINNSMAQVECVSGDMDAPGTVWVEVMQQTPECEVVVETEPVVVVGHDSFPVNRDLWTSPCLHSDDSLSMDGSLHFQKSGSMRTITQLIGQDTRTSFEHVNQIIKRGAACAKPVQQEAASRPVQSVLKRGAPKQEAAKNVVKKVILIRPGDDPEKVTAEAINRITENLNKEAAQKIAQGITPDRETVIEITRINAPPEDHVHVEDLLNTEMVPSQQQAGASGTSVPKSPDRQLAVSPEERKHRRRKSPHPKRYMYHTPSPPQAKSRTSRSAHNLSSQCYFESRPKTALNLATASSNLLGLTRGQTPVPQGASEAKYAHSVSAGTKSQTAANQSKPTILRSVRQMSLDGTASQPSPAQGLLYTDTESSLDRVMYDTTLSEVDISDTENIKKDHNSSGKVGSELDESLTNIQWLGTMSGENLEGTKSVQHKDTRLIASDRQIDLVSKECGRKKRPPYSYMHLIQMAICSIEDKRMTLREIYKWIEEKFPYYKYCPNQGWKNSIRHNLSLYDIFVREKTTGEQGKPSSSHWTIRADVPLKATKSLNSLSSSHHDRSHNHSLDTGEFLQSGSTPMYFYGEGSPSSVSHIVSGSATSRKKGPVPLLPKPPPMQTYALIPIQGGVPVIPSQPIMVSPAPSATTSSKLPKPAKHKGLAADHRRLNIRPASATEFLKTSRSHPAAELRKEILKMKRPGSAFELLRSSSLPGTSRQVVSGIGASGSGGIGASGSSWELLSGIEVKPEGLSTPPPADYSHEVHMQSSLKRNHSPEPGAAHRKHVKIAPKIDVYDDQTHTVHQKGHRSNTSKISNVSAAGSLSESSSDTTDLQNHLAHIRFADSGIGSDCSTTEQASDSTLGLPVPKLYKSVHVKDECGHSSTSQACGSRGGDKGHVVALDCSSEAGLHDILSSIEKSLSSPMRNLLRTPPKSGEKNMFTSTPFKVAFGSPSWLSPIKGLTPIAGDPSLEGYLFTPVKEGKAMTSTPVDKEPTPNHKTPGDMTPPGPSKQVTTHYSFPSLTPLKTPFKSPASKELRSAGNCERSPGDLFANQSFSKFLGEFHFDSMIDEGINLDVSNMSFSAFQ